MLPFSKILCPTDFSESSYTALEAAVALAVARQPGPDQLDTADKAELCLLHIVPPVYPSASVQPSAGEVLVDREECERAARGVAEAELQASIAAHVPPSIAVRAVTRCGDAANEILQAAESESFDLIVLGTHGHGGWHHLVLGSVAEDVARLAPCPVLAVRPQQTAGSVPIKAIEKILCPTDLSERSAAALHVAVNLAAHLRAQLDVLHVEKRPTPESESGATTQALLRMIDSEVPKRVRDSLTVNPLVRTGSPTTEIVRVARSEGADLIVIATPEQSGGWHSGYGHSAAEVMGGVPCPVLMVPGPRPDMGQAKPARTKTVRPAPKETTVVAATASPTSTDPWTVEEEEFPVRGSDTEKLRFLLNYAVLAPSIHNTQPWLWTVASAPRRTVVELRADRTRAMPHIDPQQRELTMSCGAALLYLRVALRHFGYAGAVSVLPDPSDPDLLARVGLGDLKRTPVEAHLLFQAMLKRRTNRMDVEARPLTAELRQALKDAARREGANLYFVTDNERPAVLELIEQGDWIRGHNPAWRREWADWMRPNHGPHHDGVPGYARGLGEVGSLLAPVAARLLDTGRVQAGKDRRLAKNAPVLAVLRTDGDMQRDWLAAGQALAAVLLRARVDGAYASFFNQPIEVTRLWPQLRHPLGQQECPQLLFRLGYGAAGAALKPTPRRALDEVLSTPAGSAVPATR